MIELAYDYRYAEAGRGSHPNRLLIRQLDLTEMRDLAVKATRTCSIDGCDRPFYGHDLCNAHYMRNWRAARTATCSIDGCEKTRAARGWCITHYSRWRKTGDPGPAVLFRQRGERCGVADCDRPYQGSGYCALHYTRWKKHGDPLVVLKGNFSGNTGCSVDGCAAKHRGMGFCATHLQRALNHGGDPLAVTRPYGRTACKVAGCTRPHEGNDYCDHHCRRLRLYGDPLHEEPRGPRVPLRGLLNPSWKGNRAGYRAGHDRIWRERGKASRMRCLHCGGRAAEWAYFHADPDEMYAPGKGHYSLSPRFYEPLCVPCHRRYDAWWWRRFGFGRAVMASDHN